MRADELMIGDWYSWEAEGKKYYYQVTKETFSSPDYDIYNFQPIPLTPEILEKNGFVKQDDGWYKITLEENNLAGVQNFENVSWIFGAIVFPNLIDHLGINYVHELQHALKLCKIDKKIVL